MAIELLKPPPFRRAETSAATLRAAESNASRLQIEVTRRLEQMTPDQRADIYARVTTRAYDKGLVLPPEYGSSTDRKIPLIVVPVFFDREEMLAKAAQVEHVHNALIKVEQLAFSGSDLGKRILKYVKSGMTSAEAWLLDNTEAPLPTTAGRRNTRADTFGNPEIGEMSVIEFNTTNPEGLLYHQILQETGRDFMTELGIDVPELNQGENVNSAALQAVRMFQDEYRERKGRRRAKLKTIGVIYEPENPDRTKDLSLVNRAELPRLKEFFKKHGIELNIGSPQDVTTQDGEIFVNGDHVDAIWRNAVNLEKAIDDAPGFMDVMMHPNKYIVLNDDRGRLMGSKHLLGELHDEEVQQAAGFTAEEIGAIKKIVPFSFNPNEVVMVEGPDRETLTPEEYLLRFRNEYILKPSSGTHGQDVYFGVNNGRWNDAVRRAIRDGGYVAQRYIPYDSITFPITTIMPDGSLKTKLYMRDANVQVIGGEAVGGTICRAVEEKPGEDIKILNVSEGGGLQPSFNV